MSGEIQIEDLVRDVEQLASLPDAVIRANELIDSNEADVEDIAEVVALEPALTAQLLKLVNSAFYSFPSQIDTISRAITIIGMNELRSLILSASAVDIFSKIAPDSIDMDDFWFRSVYVGLAAKQVSGDRRTAEQMFLMGLLHDVGRIILFSQAPEAAEQILTAAKQSDKHYYQVEQEVLGFTSAEVSAQLLKNWGLGDSLWKPISQMNQQDPDSDVLKQASQLHLAVRLADCTEPALKSINKEAVTAVQQECQLLEISGVNEDELEDIMEAVNLYCFEVLSVINPNSMLVF